MASRCAGATSTRHSDNTEAMHMLRTWPLMATPGLGEARIAPPSEARPTGHRVVPAAASLDLTYVFFRIPASVIGMHYGSESWMDRRTNWSSP